MTTYIIAAIHQWNIDAFKRHVPLLPGEWHLITEKKDLSEEKLKDISPRYVFFPHWSWKVPKSILEMTECVCFHMTDVPYGRGGSPLQNLIVRGKDRTMLSALKMTDDLDAGPVYIKKQLILDGRAQEIYERAADLVYDLIAEIIDGEIQPKLQKGEVEIFPRRTPEQSVMPDTKDVKQIFDHIRMMDADGYPPAFLYHGGMRFEFTKAELRGDTVVSSVRIAPNKEKDGEE